MFRLSAGRLRRQADTAAMHTAVDGDHIVPDRLSAAELTECRRDRILSGGDPAVAGSASRSGARGAGANKPAGTGPGRNAALVDRLARDHDPLVAVDLLDETLPARRQVIHDFG